MDAAKYSNADRSAPRGSFGDVALFALLAGVALLQGRALGRPFFADDYLFLEQVRGRGFFEAIASPDPIGNFARPVGRQVWFWLVGRLGGESPFAFHALNLALFLTTLFLFHRLARRLAGDRAAFLAVALLGFHYAADVPLRWASGSQDLLAIAFGTAAILWTCSAKRVLAALSLAVALLSKEVVVGVPLVAMLAVHEKGPTWRDSLRRTAALWVVTGAWSVWKLVTLLARQGADDSFRFSLTSVPATLLHFVQVFAGLEFRSMGSPFGHWTLAAIAVVIPAAALAWWYLQRRERGAPGPAREEDRRAMLVAGAWLATGLLPIVPVVGIWSAYFYLWALFGAALLAGTLARSLKGETAGVALTALLILSSNARALDEFSVGRNTWATQSHVNRHYVDRSLATLDSYLHQLKTARPELPARGTVFFADVPISAGFQTADGPLVRWAYRDSSLRSYFLNEFSREKASRGPVFFFVARGNMLEDHTNDPQFLPSLAYGSFLGEKPETAVEALDYFFTSGGSDPEMHYWRAIARLSLADHAGARSDFAAAGMNADGAHVSVPDWSAASQDTASRIAVLRDLVRRAPLDPDPHARLAAVLLARGDTDDGAIEAFAFRALAPDSADAWRKWASAQLAARQLAPGLKSLERYLAMRRSQGLPDVEAEQVAANLKRALEGGDASEQIRGTAQAGHPTGPSPRSR